MTTSEPVSTQMNSSMIFIPTVTGVNATVYVMSESDEVTAQAVQELVDLLQSWSGRDPLNNVQGMFYATTQAMVLPADAVVPPPIPDPEPDPNA